MTGKGDEKPIIISERRHGIPFSRGLLAQSLSATGLPPGKAYKVASQIQADLRERGELKVSVERLRDLSIAALEQIAGHTFAERYRKLYGLGTLDKPLVVMIGGTTGVGKSTIATEVTHRLGLTRMVSTDSIRQVMRGIFSRDLMPAIHESAFEAWRGLRTPVPHGADPVIVGFREQTSVVANGIQAVIDRAVHEGESLVVEGIHLVPGYIGLPAPDRARIVQLVIAVDDEDAHRSHFYIREVQTDGTRPFERYRASFDHIRLLGHYIEDLAREHGVPVVHSHQLDITVAETIELVLDTVMTGSEPPGSGRRGKRRKVSG